MNLAAPPAWPLAGHLPAFLRDRLGFLTRCAEDYGDSVRLQIGEPTWLVNDPTCIQHVLINHAANYEKSRRLTSEQGKRLSGRGLHTAHGADHLRRRRAMQPGFAQPAMGALFESMQRRILDCVQSWSIRPGTAVDLAAECESLALRILLGVLFGPDFDDDQLTGPITARRRYIEHMYSWLAPAPQYWPVRAVRDFRRAEPVIHGVIDRELRQPHPASLAARFTAVRFADGSPLTPTELRDEVLTMMSTGYETMGDALSWTFFLLARHPDVEARVLAELARVVGSGPLSPVDLPHLAYTSQVFEESMRLYPPTWIFVRMALGDDTLPVGIRVRRGDKLYLCPWVTHRSAKFFPDPLRFDPDRFTREAVARRPRFAYFPFGGGTHQCLGEHIARMEALTVLATILPKFRFAVDPAFVPRLRPSITLQAEGGIPACIKPR